ncbi:Mitochondrial inner membrane protein OXA1L [Smittium culicis]|uniref:Mitochondrial inner membrane protein OXA1L n=2 Tax=Smittium culicis TaxID=133412 RepID=A0A1R1XYF5_9FUNG|nr:Mitochondrial inner membrane protein OXA1L [Smittium culicis]
MSNIINYGIKSHLKVPARIGSFQLKTSSFSTLTNSNIIYKALSPKYYAQFQTNSNKNASISSRLTKNFNMNFERFNNFSTSSRVLAAIPATSANVEAASEKVNIILPSTLETSSDTLGSSQAVYSDMLSSETLPLPTEEIASTIMKIGDMKAAGLAANTPVGWVEQLLEFSHVYTGLPWWGTIITATVAIRLALFPINVILQRKIINMQNIQPEMVAIKAKLTRAQEEKNMYEYQNQASQMRMLMKKKGVSPFSTILLPIIQMPVMISFFMALRAMSELPVPSFETGGLLWFTNLAAADPYYILPAVSSLGMIALFEISKKLQSSIPSPAIMTWGMRGLGVIMTFVTMKFQSAIFVYFITSNLISTSLVFIFANPFLRKLFKIPELKKARLAITPKNTFVKTIESGLKKIKK